MLQGISQVGARLIDPDIILNPLNNWFFTSASTLLIIGLGWFVTDRIVEPRLAGVNVDGDLAEAPALEALSSAERRGLWMGLAGMLLGIVALVATSLPAGSAWRSPGGELAASAAPLMRSIVPLIFFPDPRCTATSPAP